MVKATFSKIFLLSVLLAAWGAAFVAAGPARAGADPSPGIYQNEGKSATCDLRPQPDGSWLLRFWQGDSLDGPHGGMSWSARLVKRMGSERWAGIWQATADSCCQGRGRLELEPDAEGFNLAMFSPSLASQAWPATPEGRFKLVVGLPPRPVHQDLIGAWRMRLWYTDLTPDGQPADPEEGLVIFKAKGRDLTAAWQEQPGRLSAERVDSGLSLSYHDPRAGFELKATLSPLAGGLAYSGTFRSSLGQGSMYLVRRGLPARPPGGAAEPEGGLNGLWVDPGTGNDFLAITQQGEGIKLEAFGGTRQRPRYLSMGTATPAGSGRYLGAAMDAPGHCCGNQGRLVLRRLGPDKLELSSFWWPKNQRDPGTPPTNPRLLVRFRQKQPSPGGGGWPAVFDSRPGLMGLEQGAVRVRFTVDSLAPGKAATLFNQGGYRRELELFIDGKGLLAARMATQAAGTVELRADDPIAAGGEHTAWLIYQSGRDLTLHLDGKEVAARALKSPWAGSVAPYLLGASRWPDRVLSGSIASVELWATAQDPAAPTPPEVTLTPATAAGNQGAGQAGAKVMLQRLWHPGRLMHAYAVDQDRIRRLTAEGFHLQGPLGGLYQHPAEGRAALYAHQHQQRGFTVLVADKQPPAGFKALGLMGHSPAEGEDGAMQLLRMAATFPEPLRKRVSEDRLYTTRPDQAKRARSFGYGPPQKSALVLKATEPPMAAPATYTWQGSWRGDGWGRFFILQRGRRLELFWYYSTLQGPHYFGRYILAKDGLSAKGVAVGEPGLRATYYRHRLDFELDAAAGPAIKVTSWRLAAPLMDGRLVSFKAPHISHSSLVKAGDRVPPDEAAILADRSLRLQADPARLYQQAIDLARQAGRLVPR